MIVREYTPPNGKGKRALLVNPPVYDTRYWDRWSQPYGLLRVATLLRRLGYRTELIDCLESSSKGRVRRSVKGKVEIGDVEMTFYHFGMLLSDLHSRLQSLDYIPDQVYVTSIMTYWWKSTRDVVSLVKEVFPQSEVLVGGIYPSLCPDHAAENVPADKVVVGEIREASLLRTDLSLYPNPPGYAVISASRGCPYDCAHCAQRKLNGPGVRHRDPEDVVDEILEKNHRHGIGKFAFYEDNILIDCERNFERILDLLLRKDLRFHLTAPEGFEVRLLYPRLLRKMKEAGFRSVYLPLEIASYDGEVHVDQKNVRLDEFERAVEYCRQAGYRPGIRQDVNAFILYGLPNQPLDALVDAILYAAHRVGNVTPMLFTPVPGSRLYRWYEWYFEEKGLGLADLNGKLFPFWQLGQMKPSDYIDLRRLMYAFHTQLRGKAFDLLGDSLVPKLVRESVSRWDSRPCGDSTYVASFGW
jgi:radical SAM superfamily enzyme YgiQ (UPF0313 family)